MNHAMISVFHRIDSQQAYHFMWFPVTRDMPEYLFSGPGNVAINIVDSYVHITATGDYYLTME